VRRLIGLMVAAALVVAMPTAALAAVEKQTNHFDDTFEDPFAAELCGLDQVFVHTFGTERVTEFFDKDGELIEVKIQVTGSTEVTDGDGNLLAWENWGEMIIVDFEAGKVYENGNVFNIHVQGEGIVVNDSGRIIFSLEDGSLLEVHGPHEALFTPPPVLICEALSG
jgi:hypothetical protein